MNGFAIWNLLCLLIHVLFGTPTVFRVIEVIVNSDLAIGTKGYGILTIVCTYGYLIWYCASQVQKNTKNEGKKKEAINLVLIGVLIVALTMMFLSALS